MNKKTGAVVVGKPPWTPDQKRLVLEKVADCGGNIATAIGQLARFDETTYQHLDESTVRYWLKQASKADQPAATSAAERKQHVGAPRVLEPSTEAEIRKMIMGLVEGRTRITRR